MITDKKPYEQEETSNHSDFVENKTTSVKNSEQNAEPIQAFKDKLDEDLRRQIYELHRQFNEKQNELHPPEEMYRSKSPSKNDRVSYGLNMFFKKHHEFSMDEDSGGGELALN